MFVLCQVSNNPCAIAIHEARCIWGKERDISCVLSIGTGKGVEGEQQKGFADLLRTVLYGVTDVERTHEVLEVWNKVHCVRVVQVLLLLQCHGYSWSTDPSGTIGSTATTNLLSIQPSKRVGRCGIGRGPSREIEPNASGYGIVYQGQPSNIRSIMYTTGIGSVRATTLPCFLLLLALRALDGNSRAIIYCSFLIAINLC
jgi:hypothetical protein